MLQSERRIERLTTIEKVTAALDDRRVSPLTKNNK